MRLNEKTIKTLTPPVKGNRISYDDDLPGFGLRTTAAGAKAFVLTYWIGRRQRRMTIGRWPTWSAMAARERARQLRRKIDQGEDPLAAKEQRRSAPTVRDIAEQYLERYAVKKKTGYIDREYLNRDVIPAWGTLVAADLRRRDVIDLVERKAKTTPIAGNMLLTIVKGVFNWAVENDYLETNPAARVKPPAEKKPRDRWLNEGEIRTVWTKLDAAKMLPQGRSALRLILAVGQRSGEVLSAEWNEIDIESALWVIPASKSKNGKQQTVPLSPIVLELLKPLPRGRWVFPARYDDCSHLTVVGLSNAVAANREHFGIPRWTPHDLRRTCATHLAKLGVARLVIERVLNHADRTVTATYDQHSYDDSARL